MACKVAFGPLGHPFTTLWEFKHMSDSFIILIKTFPPYPSHENTFRKRRILVFYFDKCELYLAVRKFIDQVDQFALCKQYVAQLK